jgi:hypothetical protein
MPRTAHSILPLHAVAAFDVDALHALMAGYVAATEHGTWYRLVGARGPVRLVLQHAGVLEVLADSDDLGAFMPAVLLQPAPPTFGDGR